MDKSSLGDRMKGYEHAARAVLTRRTPVILRVDGRAFHTFTRGFNEPFDAILHNAMVATANALVKEIQGAKVAYGQSDEISVLITDYDTLTTDAWFGYGIQKMVSIAASVATIVFNDAIGEYGQPHGSVRRKAAAQFDARVFNLPKEDVVNYFVWRQQDATRNSIQMVARCYFSHGQCHKKNTDELQEMLMSECRVNWNDTPTHFKRGFCVVGPDTPDREIPIFTQDREYLERFVHPDLPILR
ncbi:MAG: tRNA(His) guanylyltransferase Thg1 family protein [Hydrogenophaga sp.]|uniref:tRNA(His) guanylyltransferase Thg1 family protein n=1 Tax=Hydrogenophaga sp. TaxID=1904254 RepID=UPI00260D3013|nr:tRNA(His) guanylyltransferase Thg1 family protein [Hydrogenophaga sp.]MCV0439861.1 tRNA(His) guanylyltransferase Thg1 family protein [Hydrogenophaga sp.]